MGRRNNVAVFVSPLCLVTDNGVPGEGYRGCLSPSRVSFYPAKVSSNSPLNPFAGWIRPETPGSSAKQTLGGRDAPVKAAAGAMDSASRALTVCVPLRVPPGLKYEQNKGNAVWMSSPAKSLHPSVLWHSHERQQGMLSSAVPFSCLWFLALNTDGR